MAKRGTNTEIEATLDDLGQTESRVTPADTWRYAYDDASRLESIEQNGQRVASYLHDSDGTRRRKIAGDVTTWYVTPDFEVREDRRSGRVARTTHVRGIGGERLFSVTDAGLPGTDLLADIRAAAGLPFAGETLDGAPEGRFWLLGDHLGSTAVVLDDAGAPVTRYYHLPYGALDTTRSTGRDTVSHRYAAQEHDAESGLEDYGARAYDTGLHRFLTADSKTPGGGGNPQGLNRHAYVMGNPIRYADPTGHQSELPLALELGVTRELLSFVPVVGPLLDMRDATERARGAHDAYLYANGSYWDYSREADLEFLYGLLFFADAASLGSYTLFRDGAAVTLFARTSLRDGAAHNAEKLLEANRAAGRAAQIEAVETMAPKLEQATEELSIVPYLDDGSLADFRVRMDIFGYEVGTKIPIYLEVKASLTAPLTHNQTLGIPLLELNGGMIVGHAGDLTDLPAGTIIPPLVCHICRIGE